MENYPGYGYDYDQDVQYEDEDEYILIMSDTYDEDDTPYSPYPALEEEAVPDYSLSYADDYIPEPEPSEAPVSGPAQNISFEDGEAEKEKDKDEEASGRTGYNFGDTLYPYETDMMSFPSEFGGYEGAMYPYEYVASGEKLPDIKSAEDLLSFLRERADTRKQASPLLILGLLLTCFPVGLGVMYFGTKWGVFSKVLITIFVLAIAIAVYELLIIKQVISLPSIVEMLSGAVNDLTSEF